MINASVGRWPSVYVGLAVALCWWTAGIVGGLRVLDGAVYDTVHRSWPPVATQPPSVLLIEWDPSDRRLGPEAPLKILRSLRKLGARSVVFTEIPAQAPASFFHEADGGDVLFGRLAIESADPEVQSLESFPPGLQALPAFGVSILPPTEAGVARRHPSAVAVGDQIYPTLEFAAAKTEVPAASEFVSFRGGPRSLPHASAQALVDGALILELVRDRVVLVGRPAQGLPTIATPTTSDRNGMSILEFRGHAVNTLLTGGPLREVPALVQVLLLVGLTGASAVMYQWLRTSTALWACLVLTAVILAACIVLFTAFGIWIPVTGFVGAQLVTLFLVESQKAHSAYRSGRRLQLALSTELRERSVPANFYESTEEGALAAGFVTQVLDVERILFLEVHGRQLQLAGWYGVSADTVLERRRDFAREPFARALKSEKPIRVDAADRPFLDSGDAPEYQFIAPLSFAGHLMGFWVISAQTERADAIPNFVDLLDEYSRQFGELLFHRSRLGRERAGQSWLARLLFHASDEADHERLSDAVRAIDRRMKRSELVFAGGATPVAAYDLFGRLRELNGAMRSHLQALGCAPFQQTAADVVAALSGGSLPFARKCLRNVIHSRKELSLPAVDLGARHFLLRIYPLENQENALSDEPAPFGLAGIGCELLEQTAAIQLQKLKKQFAGQVGVHLRNDLAAVELSASMLAAEDLAPAEREELVALIHEKVGQIVKTLVNMQQYNDAGPLGGSARLPLDPSKLWEEVAADEEANARARGVTVMVDGSALIVYTVANPDSLRRLFKAALAYLIEDARSGSSINAQANDTADTIIYTIRNDGFGVPGEKLAEFLASDEILADPVLETLRTAAAEASAWGGRLEASSTPGTGTVIRVVMPRFV